MRTLLKAFLCGVVVAAMGGCGGRSDVSIPKTFAPPPAKEQKPDIAGKAPTKGLPSKAPGKRGPGRPG
jgi:hypothetical protein